MSHGTGISADGNVVSGYSDGAGQPGFVWTRGVGRNDFGLDIPAVTTALGISGDGRYAVGGMITPAPIDRAFRWSQAGGYEPLAGTPFAHAEAYDASFDGSVVVGIGGTAGSPWPMRWTSSGGQLLSNTTQGYARAVSRDGNTVVGDAFFPSRAFVWTPNAGMQFLTGLNGSPAGALARAVSSDGSIVVGTSAISSGGFPPTMWINGVAQRLLYGDSSHVSFIPLSVSDDGGVVCGSLDGGTTAGVWTTATGIIPLADYLAMYGLAIPADRQLSICRGVSADGRGFVGDAWQSGINAQAFVATIPAPGAMTALLVAMGLAVRRVAWLKSERPGGMLVALDRHVLRARRSAA